MFRPQLPVAYALSSQAHIPWSPSTVFPSPQGSSCSHPSLHLSNTWRLGRSLGRCATSRVDRTFASRTKDHAKVPSPESTFLSVRGCSNRHPSVHGTFFSLRTKCAQRAVALHSERRSPTAKRSRGAVASAANTWSCQIATFCGCMLAVWRRSKTLQHYPGICRCSREGPAALQACADRRWRPENIS